MRHGFWALAVPSVFAFDIVLLAACGDDSGTPPPVDASSEASPDASMDAFGADATTDATADRTTEGGDATRAGDGA
jgi:hypothetical protein